MTKGFWITHVTRATLLGAGLEQTALEDTQVCVGMPNGAYILPAHYKRALAVCAEASLDDTLKPGQRVGVQYTARKLAELVTY